MSRGLRDLPLLNHGLHPVRSGKDCRESHDSLPFRLVVVVFPTTSGTDGVALREGRSEFSGKSVNLFQDGKSVHRAVYQSGGRFGARTRDPLLVRQMLSQLSYPSVSSSAPSKKTYRCGRGLGLEYAYESFPSGVARFRTSPESTSWPGPLISPALECAGLPQSSAGSQSVASVSTVMVTRVSGMGS